MNKFIFPLIVVCDLCNYISNILVNLFYKKLTFFLIRINLPLFFTVVPAVIFVVLSCRPFVAITTLSTGFVGVEVTSSSWLEQLTVDSWQHGVLKITNSMKRRPDNHGVMFNIIIKATPYIAIRKNFND